MSQFGPSTNPACRIDSKLWLQLTNEQREFFVLWEQWAPADLPWPVPEVRFAKLLLGRLWMADIAWPYCKVILELEGGIFARKGGRSCPSCGQTEAGAHGKATGILRDICKYNAAGALHWMVFRVPVPEFKKAPGVILDMAVDLVKARYRQREAHNDLTRILGKLAREVPAELVEQVIEATSHLETLGLAPYSTDRKWAAKEWTPKPQRKGHKRRRR